MEKSLLINNNSYKAIVIAQGPYFDKKIYARFDKNLEKLFVDEGIDKGFSVGIEYVKIKLKCDCSCHTDGAVVMHFIACCDNEGYEFYYKKITTNE